MCIRDRYKPITKDRRTDSDETLEHEEYAISIEDQDEIFAILACLEEILRNRDTILYADEKVKINKKVLFQGKEYSSRHRKLFDELRLVEGIPFNAIFEDLNSSKTIIRKISNNQKRFGENTSFEDYLLGYQDETQKMISENKKLRETLKQFNVVYNARLEYYSHLQKISDSVAPLINLDPVARNTILKAVNSNEKSRTIEKNINTTESRIKYLKGLQSLRESIENNKSFKCSICLQDISLGSMLKCGHFFCKRCITSWLKNKKNCPMCKMVTTASEIYNFKFKEEKLEGDTSQMNEDLNNNIDMQKRNANMPDKVLSENDYFLALDKYTVFPELNYLNGLPTKESFGAKIDFVLKLILYLKSKAETDQERPCLLYTSRCV